jgi:hypothetical protein
MTKLTLAMFVRTNPYTFHLIAFLSVAFPNPTTSCFACTTGTPITGWLTRAISYQQLSSSTNCLFTH